MDYRHSYGCSDYIQKSGYNGSDKVKETKADLARRFDALNLKCDVPKFNSEPRDRQQHDDVKRLTRGISDMPVAKMRGELDMSGDRGKVIQLKTNNYRLMLKDADNSEYYIYEFQAKVAASAKNEVRGRPPLAVKKESKRKIVAMLGRVLNIKFAFDGESLLISPRKLVGFQEMEDRDCNIVEDQNGARFRVTYQVGDKEETAEGDLVARHILSTKSVHEYMSGGNMEDYPQDVIQAIEIILRTNPAFHAA
ncbi:unnamed protein product [Oikopleura dioica]|uniref:Protein argonaute N-terminal domain-containing protein n=1 Tax=Oikopleura dioica TaxID=34765 RepID=E4Y8N2_OIKDI|nr:unnamed protein product [Oikopleura dioica]